MTTFTPMERSCLLRKAYLFGAAAILIGLVAAAPNARADGNLRLNSTMNATCLDKQCTVLRFALDVQTDVFVGWLRLRANTTDFRFGEVLGVTDRYGNVVDFTSVLSDDGLILTEIQAFGEEPLYLTVQMASTGGREQVSGLTYSGAATVTGDGKGTIYRFDGPVALAPEPISMILLGTGLAGVAGAARRRRKRLDVS